MSEGLAFHRGYAAGNDHGRREERAAIVAWLRERALLRWGDAVDYAADIESGQHLRGDDE